MFVDLNNLVQMQGEMVSRIEDHVNHAEVDIEKGREDLGKAENFKKAANKKKFILAAILAVVVLIILLGKVKTLPHACKYFTPSDNFIPELAKHLTLYGRYFLFGKGLGFDVFSLCFS